MDVLGKLGINLGLFLAYFVNVVLLLFLLRAFAYKPVLRMLDTRHERIAEGLENARKADQALASAEADRKALVDEARAEAGKIISDARELANAQAKQIIDRAQEEARVLVRKAEELAKSEQDKALADLREQIADLGMAAAGHLIGTKLSEKQARAAISDFFVTVPAEAKGMGDSFTVTTALPLTDEERGKFTRELGSEEVTFKVNPAILGGAIVRSGANEIDASYLHQLEQMRGSLNS